MPAPWNPHYVAYARAHGKAPEAMLEHDRNRWVGGCMTGFLLWMSEAKQAFRRESPGSFMQHDRATIADHTAWAAFVQQYADRSTPPSKELPHA